MRIHTVAANNFKSLVDFKLEFSKLICLIGLNGSGKSTVLQFIDFLAQQVRGDIKGWLKERSWKASDINSRLTGKKNVEFSIGLVSSEDEGGMTWSASFNTSQLHCTTERIETPEAILEVQKGQLRILDKRRAVAENGSEVHSEKISFSYEGSILSQLRKETLRPYPSLVGFKDYFARVKSLDLLSPEYLRQRTRESAGSLGLGGQRLAAFLYELGMPKRRALVKQLKRAYPQLEDLHARSLRSGWKQLEITEKYRSRGAGFFPRMTTEARHVNDGMLRLIAVLAELQSEHRFLLFDEIENGINPELVEFVLDALNATDKQVLVTTHSPMILNYLSDEVARKGVIYLYKTPQGATRAIPFFSIPSLAEKLTVMGPGEVFADTNLNALSEEIQSVTQGR
jgi:predicted ATPase